MGGKANRTGRGAPAAKHVRLYRHLLVTEAWRHLSCYGRGLYVELAYRYNGENNGRIPLSKRDAAMALNTCTNTASKAFCEFQNTGFIKVATLGSFTNKRRNSTEWILTEYGLRNERPTKEYQKWKPVSQKQNTVSPRDTDRCHLVVPRSAHGITS